MKKKILLVISILLLSVSLSTQVKCEEYSTAATSFYNKGIYYYQSKSYKLAIDSFKKAIELEPEFIDAYYNLGAIYEFTGDNELAIQTYAKLLRINPEDFDATFEIAKAYFKQSSFNISLKYLNDIPSIYSKYQEVQEYKTKVNKAIAAKNRPKIQPPKIEQIENKNHSISSKEIIGHFASPTGMATDSLGNLYIANYSNNSISKVSKDNKCSTFLKSTLIKGPIGLVIDKYNNLYIANYEGNSVLKVSPSAQISTLIPKINKPYCLHIVSNKLYISEQFSNTVQKHTLY